MAWTVWKTVFLSSFVLLTSGAAVRNHRRAAAEPTGVEESAADLKELASKLHLDYSCLLQPFNSASVQLEPGYRLFVPLHCCRNSCQGDFCRQRNECHGDAESASPNAASGTSGNVMITIVQSVFTTVAGSETVTPSFPTPPTAPVTTVTNGLTLTAGPTRTSTLEISQIPTTEASAFVTTVSGKALTFSTDRPITEVTTTVAEGLTLTLSPEELTPTAVLTTALEDGDPVTLSFSEPVTTSTAITTNGETFIIGAESKPAVSLATTTNSEGLTILSQSDQQFTFPTGLTHATTATGSDDFIITFSPSPTTTQGTTVTSDTAEGFLFPVTTTVPEPTPTDGGTVVPCDLWFFNSCLQWEEFPILGWQFDLPSGVRPPGPPPPISIDPKFSVSIDINGKLPPWPAITIGPDRVPTYKQEPENECQTESAELCATSTSYGVTRSDASAVTTSSETLSTCATVYGCNAEGTSTETTTTSGCTKETTAANGDVSCPTAVPYFISSKKGTEKAVFDDYVNKLPDKGKGRWLSFPETPWQSYVTNLTSEQAEDAEKQPFMYFVTEVVAPPVDTDNSFAIPPTSGSLERRLLGDLEHRSNSEQHLRMISAKKSKNPLSSRKLADYTFDPSLGNGQTIYIVDDGFNLDHTELQPTKDRTVDHYFLPNDITLPSDPPELRAPEDINCHTIYGHGTHVASIAGGIRQGVASKANLVLVKHKNSAKNLGAASGEYKNRMVSNEAMEQAWDWMMADVKRRRSAGDNGKFIFEMAGGVDYRGRYWRKLDIMTRVLKTCKEMDIIVVVAAGNDGKDSSLNDATPQNLGEPTNELITVGAVNNDGTLWERTTRDKGDGGSISVYAVGEQVMGAGPAGNDATVRYDGTSQASPAVAGLAAYFAGLPSLEQEWRPGQVAMDMKQYIIKYAFKRLDNPVPARLNYPVDPETIKVIYNRAGQGLCAKKNPPDRRSLIRGPNYIARREDPSDVDVMVDGEIVAPDFVNSYCGDDAAPADEATATETGDDEPSETANSGTSSLPPPATTLSDLPDLPTGTSAPAGSSCVSTATETRCVLDHQGTSSTITACATTTACASWAGSPAPTVNTNKGILTCGTKEKTGDDLTDAEFFFTGGQMDHARDAFCSNMTQNSVPIKFERGESEQQWGTYVAPDNPNNPIYLAASWDADDGQDCPTIDFDGNADAYHLCQDRLNVAIRQCGDYDAGIGVATIQGGTFFRDCVTWEITSWQVVEGS